jgi:DNA invertase Pin-like site-specific DNA recombinase
VAAVLRQRPDELESLDVAFVSLGESIDTGTPAGRLQLHLLAPV